MCFVPFPGPNSSGDEVRGEHTVPGGPCILITSPVPATQFPRCVARAPSQVCCVCPLGSCSLAATLLADVNHPGSQEDLVSNWEPAHSLVEDAISGAEIAPCLLALAVAHLLLCLWVVGRCWSTAGYLSFGIHSVLCSVSRPSSVLGQSFLQESSLSPSFSLSLDIPQLGLLSHVSSLRLSSGHSGPVLTLSNAACTSLFSPPHWWLI